MDLTYLGKWALSTKSPGQTFGPECLLTVYIHSEGLTIHSECFNSRTNYGVAIYTVQTTMPSSLNNSSYVTFHVGIPHAYVAGYQAPTCTEAGVNGYTTDCPCGGQLDGSVVVKEYVKNLTEYTEVTYESEIIPALGHDILGGTISITYTSFCENGDAVYLCSVCETAHTKEGGASALFKFRGYSIKDDGTAFCIEYGANMAAVKNYEAANGVTVNVGVFAMISDYMGGKAPHEVIGNTEYGYIDAPIPKEDNIENLTLKIKGFNTDELKAIGLVMAAYMSVTDGNGTNTYYFQSEQCENPSSYSMAQYLIDTAA